MKRIRFFGVFVCLITPMTAFADTSLADCRAIAADTDRLACYDALAAAESAGGGAAPDAIDTATAADITVDPASGAVAASEPVVEERREDAVSLDDPVDLFGRSDREIRDVAVRESAGHSLDRITATATGVLETASGRLVITLDNDQVWEQTESERFRLRAGEEVEIRRGRLSSYFLKRSGTNRSIRVRRRE